MRLTWLVGPPGAGKSTYAMKQVQYPRVIEFEDMLAPIAKPVKMRKGILQANSKLVEIVRHLEFHPENIHLPSLLVVAGLVEKKILFPLKEDEEVLLLLPSKDQWEKQLYSRPINGGSSSQYDDYDYSKLWYERFENWLKEGINCKRLEISFKPELIGKICDQNKNLLY